MSEIGIEDVCRVFIKEKLPQKEHSGRRPPVGKNTEKKMRELLNELFVEDGLTFRDCKMTEELILRADDFVRSGVTRTRSFGPSLHQSWGQCDLYGEKDNRVRMLGEIKTTTSALHNVCGLINKNLTALRKFKASPLSIVLYPDKRPDALAEDHRKVINGLFASKLVSREELNTLRDCFFILTNIGWKGGLEKRTRTVSSFPPNDLDSVVDENQLLRNGDINRAEWERLKSYLNTQASL